jgi:hypothetical protein
MANSFETTILDEITDDLVRGFRYVDNFLELKNGKVSREGWRRYDRRMRANLLGRTGLALCFRDIFKPDAVKTVKLETNTRIKIACISSTFWLDDPTETKKGDPSADLRMKVYPDWCYLAESVGDEADKATERWMEERLEELKIAIDAEADVICFGEFAYPPPPVDPSGSTIEAMQRCIDRRKDFETRVIDMIEEARENNKSYQPFVFLGSYHCLLTMYGIGIVYPWGTNRTEVMASTSDDIGNDEQDVKSKVEKLNAPVLYRKRFPARRVGESTRVPATMNVDVYETSFGRVAIMLCSDVLDLNQFMAIRRHNANSQRGPIDFVLVPSYNRSTKLASMCRELSYAARCAVVLVNANPKRPDFPGTDIYVCGLTASQLRKHTLGGKVLPERPKRNDFSGKSRRPSEITFFDINLRALKGFINKTVSAPIAVTPARRDDA